MLGDVHALSKSAIQCNFFSGLAASPHAEDAIFSFFCDRASRSSWTWLVSTNIHSRAFLSCVWQTSRAKFRTHLPQPAPGMHALSTVLGVCMNCSLLSFDASIPDISSCSDRSFCLTFRQLVTSSAWWWFGLLLHSSLHASLPHGWLWILVCIHFAVSLEEIVVSYGIVVGYLIFTFFFFVLFFTCVL